MEGTAFIQLTKNDFDNFMDLILRFTSPSLYYFCRYVFLLAVKH